MIKISWQTLNQKPFIDTLQKLTTKDKDGKMPLDALDARTKLRVGLIMQSCHMEMMKAQAEAKALLEKYAVKNEKGEVDGYPDVEKIRFAKPEDEHKHNTEFADMLKSNKFRVPVDRVEASSLDPLGLRTEELLALKDILVDI